jgi:hypothetical protein
MKKDIARRSISANSIPPSGSYSRMNESRTARNCAAVGEQVPVVVFCVEGAGEGGEAAIGQNVHITQPDNFNQLRRLLTRLLQEIPIAA